MSRLTNSVYPLLLWSVLGSGWSVGADQQLAQSAVPLTAGNYGWTELMDAAAKGDFAKVRDLLAKGADANAGDRSGRTALMAAANAQIAQALIARGANVNAKSSTGATALNNAITWNRADVAKVLLDRGADPNVKGTLGPVLVDASARGQVTIVRALLDKGADANVKSSIGDTPLLHAVEARKAAVVEALLDKGADPNAKDRYGQTPLILAAERGDEAIVRSLLRKKADLKAVARLSPMGGTNADTALKRAAAGGHTAAARALLDNGADIDAKGGSGDTALMIASAAGQEGVVRLLVEKGADVGLRNQAGKSALGMAQASGRTGIVRILLAKESATAEAKGKGTAVLIYFQGGGGECHLKSWNPPDPLSKLLLTLSQCPDKVFVAEEAGALVSVKGNTVQEILIKPTVNLKSPTRLPSADAILLAGYLPDGRPAAVSEKVGPASDSELSLFGFGRGKWDLVESKNCGRFFTVKTCLKVQVKGRGWDDWGEETEVWHPKLALNPVVVSRGDATREGGRFVLDKRSGSKDDPIWGYVKFRANNRQSILFHDSRLVEGDAGEGMVTSSLYLQTHKNPSPAAIAEGQLNTAIEQKYLLIGTYHDVRLVDLETGEEPLGVLKFAFWTH